MSNFLKFKTNLFFQKSQNQVLYFVIQFFLNIKQLFPKKLKQIIKLKKQNKFKSIFFLMSNF